jgi:hypothetical protein
MRTHLRWYSEEGRYTKVVCAVVRSANLAGEDGRTWSRGVLLRIPKIGRQSSLFCRLRLSVGEKGQSDCVRRYR